MNQPLSYYCSYHNRKEVAVDEPYIGCSECGHIYNTAQELVDALITERQYFSTIDTVYLVSACPYCAHDF